MVLPYFINIAPSYYITFRRCTYTYEYTEVLFTKMPFFNVKWYLDWIITGISPTPFELITFEFSYEFSNVSYLFENKEIILVAKTARK